MHIIGAGGHAKVVIDILLESQVQIEGVWDDDQSLKAIAGYSLNGDFDKFKQVDSTNFIICIGNNKTRKKLAGQLLTSTNMALHPKSSISRFAKIGVGSVVMANASLNAGAQIGDHVIVNTNASIDHDCKIGDFVHISPNAVLGGDVIVGEGTHIGLGASVIQGVKIGNWVIIGAGAVIIRDVPDYAVIVGNPGRIIKYSNSK